MEEKEKIVLGHLVLNAVRIMLAIQALFLSNKQSNLHDHHITGQAIFSSVSVQRTSV